MTDQSHTIVGSLTSNHRRTGRQGFALAALAAAQFMVVLDSSIVNVALPSIRAGLGLGPAELSWVVDGYLVAFGGLLLLGGRLADATFVFPSTKSNVRTELLYGANHGKATNSAIQKGGSTDLPEQLVAGRSVTMTSTFTMRAGGADNVVFRFNPDNTTTDDITFTNVQILYK